MNNKNLSVLAISNKDDILSFLEQELNSLGFRVITAKALNEGKLKISNQKFDLLILDFELDTTKAQDFVMKVRQKEEYNNIKNALPIFVVGNNPEEYTSNFSAVDHSKFLQYPIDGNELKAKITEFGFPGPTNKDVISSNTRNIKKDEFLIEEGGKSLEMYWVLSGSFVVTKLNEENHRVVIGKIFSGELVGEMSFLDNLPRSASVKALEDSEVLVIPHKKFIDVMEGQPRWFRSLMQTLSQRLRGANKMIAQRTSSSEVCILEDDDDDQALQQLKVDV